MSKLNLIFEVASFASVLLAGGATINNLKESEPIPEPTVENVSEEKTEEIATKPNVTETESNVTDSKENVTAPEVNVTKPTQVEAPSTPQPTVAPKPTPTPAPSTPTYKYTNAIEFQRAYMGWCPKDVPADAYHHALPKSIALGYMDIDYFSYKTPEEAAIYVWSWYQGARVNSVNDGSAFLDIYYDKMNEPIISNNQSYENFVIKADGYTKTVTWDTWDKNGKTKLPQDVIKAMDNVTKRIHDKMVQLDQQYYAKCGY